MCLIVVKDFREEKKETTKKEMNKNINKCTNDMWSQHKYIIYFFDLEINALTQRQPVSLNDD